MRSYAPEFDMVVASDLASALDAVQRGFQPFAGGTDIMVLFNAGKLPAGSFVGICKLPELSGIAITPEFVELGAAVTYTQVREHRNAREEFQLLQQAASWTGSIANQNRGTLGGNIANASPAADSSPVLLVYEAELKLVSGRGERWVSYADFHLGYKSLAMRRDEMIALIRIPRRHAGMLQYSRKVGTRRAQAIAKVSFAALTDSEGFFRIAIGSVAPVPLRCVRTEQFLAGERITASVIEQAKEVVRGEISPITDIRSTRDYRLTVTENLLGEFLERLL